MKHDVRLLSRVVRAWRRRSVGEFSRLLVYNLGLMATGKYREANHAFDQSFDHRFNVETAGTEEPEFLTAEDNLKAHAKGYEPVTEEQIQTLLKMLPAADFSASIFIDLGSGKGRALFVAASYPFHQIIGVEYSHELHEVAVRNVRTYRNPGQKCFDIKPVRADATTFGLPESPTVCFINNPYGESMIARTAKNIDQSVRAAPRPFFIVYIHAYYSGPIDAMPGWSRICDGSLGQSSYVIWRWDVGIPL
jgi:16S rRNA G966 N2-methylase RsmD